MHHILLIFFLFLIFCGPLAVIRAALGCVTLIVLAAVLIALKSAGHQITWAAQFTNPLPVSATGVLKLNHRPQRSQSKNQ